MFAAERNHSDCVARLIEYGANVHARDKVSTAFHLLFCNSEGQNLNIKLNFAVTSSLCQASLTALMIAAGSGKKSLLDMLLQMHADMEEEVSCVSSIIVI